MDLQLQVWAEEAHWSIGGLSFKRLRLQGKIEGNVQRLRSQREKGQAQSPPPPPRSVLRGSKGASSPSPPPAPFVTKRRRYMDPIQEEKEEVETPSNGVRKSHLVKKLGGDFDRVASMENEGAETTLFKTLSSRFFKGGEPVKKTVVEAAENSNRKAKKITIRGG